MSTATTPPAKAAPKPNLTKQLKAVKDRHAKRQATQALTGVVVSTGAQVETATPGRGARAAAMAGRIGKGIATAPKALKAYRLATEYDSKIVGLEEAGDHAKALAGTAAQHAEAEKRRKRVGVILREAAIIFPPLAFGGWFWVTLVLVLVLAAELALLKVKAMHGKVCARTAQMLGVSLLLEVIMGAGCGVHPSPVSSHGFQGAWSGWYLLPPALVLAPALLALVGWAIAATKDDGSLADNLGVGTMAPAEPSTDEARDHVILKAITSSEAKLAKDAAPIVVAPGVTPLLGGKLWTVTIDTGGQDAGPIVAARRDIASRLGLSGPRLLVEQSAEYGRRVRLTGIVESPWGDPTPSPLLDLEKFTFGTPIPYANTMLGEPWLLPMFEMHYLIGGMMRRGKSSSCYPIYVSAGLDPLAPIWIIDGGDVDTRPWHENGVTRRWTTSPEEASDVLDDVIAEIEMRQDLLGQEKLIRPNPEFYARHDMSDGLLGFDEFASFTNCADRKLAGQISRKLVTIIQRSPKTNIHVVLSTQSPSAKAFDTDGRGVINGRAALLCDGPEMSDKIMGSGSASRGVDASTLEEGVKGLQWMSVPGDTRIVRPHLITPEQVQAVAARAGRARSATGTGAPDKPEAPRVLVEMVRLLSEPSRDGRMRSVEVAAAMAAYGIITVTEADRAGHEKTDEQIRQEKLAALVKPFGVRPRPDRADGNRTAYWLEKEHRDLGEVGVGPALERVERGRPPASETGHTGSPKRASAGSPAGSPERRRLHVV